jgi:trigger factor
VEETSLPTLDDAFAKEKLRSESADAFKKMVEQSIVSQEEQFERMRRERELLDEIAKRTDVEIAPEILEEEMRMLIQDFAQRLEERGSNLDEWVKQQNKKPEEIDADMRKQAEQRIRLRFGMAKLIEERGIKLSEEEMDKAVREFITSSVPEDQRLTASQNIQPGSQAYQELQWRATVDKLVDQLLAA